MAANRETSSTTGIVFAKAKSEWVIPQRAKPGRKSSKVAIESAIQSKPAPSATSGSRDAQRAFRERKTEYVASLEARIESFEKGEIQRNVALQATARAMKDENTKIKVELSLVRRDLNVRERECRGKDVEVKRLEGALVEMRSKLGRTERLIVEAEKKGYERARREMRGQGSVSASTSAAATVVGSRRGSGSIDVHQVEDEEDDDDDDEEEDDEDERDYRPNMMALETISPSNPTPTPPGPSPPILDRSRPSQRMTSLPSDDDVDSFSRQVAMDMACGFCEGIESVCVCRIVRENERNNKNNGDHRHGYDNAGGEVAGVFTFNADPTSGQGMGIVNPVTKQLSPTYHAEITAAVKSTSILDNLPPIQAAVPLRRRRPDNGGANASNNGTGVSSAIFGIKKAPIFAVSPAVLQDGQNSPSYIAPAECSGDPRNCPACKDDDFGREFCESLSKSMCNNEPGHRCENCPSQQNIKASASNPTPAPMTAPVPINRTRSSITSVSSTAGPAQSQSMGSDKVSSSPTDIEAEYLDIKCCGNSKLCGTLDKHCGDDELVNPEQPHSHQHQHERGYANAAATSLSGSSMPTGTWEEKISQLAPHGHEVDVTLSADEAWKTLKAHPNAKFASLAMLADVVARGTKCIGQPGAPSPSPRFEKPDPFASVSIPKARPVESTSTGSKRRRFEVHSYAVKEALAVLDAHPNHPLKKRRLSDLRGT